MNQWSQLAEDAELIRSLDGLHVGLLTEEEQQAFNRLVLAGMAKREYSGAAGFLGIARVRIVDAEEA